MNVKFREYFQINNAFFEKKLTQIIIPVQIKPTKSFQIHLKYHFTFYHIECFK
ncbi:hypothetical protein SAMN03080594_10964 [Arenibacter palladensis]|uniref:Uncharacterized protein n=1 Tax=Arenibacter palladensis TaxID=237373 RepID=A0A1M5FGZ2_9FLAO|nr:hypothetical protein SAMN03080594_10964 [Arenibacter palladensis]